jgi:hypothetical protein
MEHLEREEKLNKQPTHPWKKLVFVSVVLISLCSMSIWELLDSVSFKLDPAVVLALIIPAINICAGILLFWKSRLTVLICIILQILQAITVRTPVMSLSFRLPFDFGPSFYSHDYSIGLNIIALVCLSLLLKARSEMPKPKSGPRTSEETAQPIVRKWQDVWRNKMKYHTAVAIKGNFDASFPDLRNVKKGEDRIPGRCFGELVVQGLVRHGLQATGPLNEEPFFAVPCRSGDYEYRVLCYLLEPGQDPVWVIECPRNFGFIAKWRGKSEEAELGAVVMAIHETLKNDSHVREIRWFQKLPDTPFEESRYGITPVVAT